MRSSATALTLGADNAATLAREIGWLSRVIEARYKQYFACDDTPFSVLPVPDLQGDSSAYAATVRELGMTADERIVVMLALMLHVRPQALDPMLMNNATLNRRYTEVGGRVSETHGGFLPTCQTAAFILAGDDLARRFAVLTLFDDAHFFARRRMLRLEATAGGEPQSGRLLVLSNDYVQRFTTGERYTVEEFYSARYTGNLPASMITSPLRREDLVLVVEAHKELDLVASWLNQQYSELRDWGLERIMPNGYRCLFAGPPGTGKTLAAMLLGSTAGVGVCRVDLSMLAMMPIGDIAQTKQDLAQLFELAQEQRWLLYFDAAGSVFDWRMPGHGAILHDVLQRIEDFAGLAIVSAHNKADIDPQFAGRCDSVIDFALPDAALRLQLWRQALPGPQRLAADVDLPALAQQHELSGGAILNVVRHAALRAVTAGSTTIAQNDLLLGVAREMGKLAGLRQPATRQAL